MLLAVVVTVAVVILGVVGVTTTLVVRSGSEPTQLSAVSTTSPDASVAPATEPDEDAGQAAAGHDSGTGSPSARAASPTAPGTAAPSTGPAAPPGTAAPAAPAPRAPAPAAPAPAPTTKAPAAPAPTKAPATKAPTKAPAPKAPEINKAVAKPGTRGAGPCSKKLAAGYGCLQTYGDVWWVYDTKADGHSAVVFWEVGSGTAKRTGQCANSMGNGKIGVCNKNYAEGTSGRAKVCIMDWDTKQVHQCTAYFSFKTG
ncbi:hypothetical protein SAMN05443668_102240 [Cryptosporangium aurantiacum]|uniref:Uncharacterized protein n=1 Tax=Cryptosporangium aurantiacum TaxID=134849 RepID=A0A1M7MS86_9ACTN|nr:hypothetical protein SAMN05443668_102240 [Cryptosporangium aurantiacum]